MKINKAKETRAAKRVAKNLWGKPYSCLELGKGLWHFYGENDDGLIVDTGLYPVTKDWAAFKKARRGKPSQQERFAAFTQGRPWNICEWLLADVLYSPVFRTLFDIQILNDTDWAKMRVSKIREYMETYCPLVVQRFPEEGIFRLENALYGEEAPTRW